MVPSSAVPQIPRTAPSSPRTTNCLAATRSATVPGTPYREETDTSATPSPRRIAIPIMSDEVEPLEAPILPFHLVDPVAQRPLEPHPPGILPHPRTRILVADHARLATSSRK